MQGWPVQAPPPSLPVGQSATCSASTFAQQSHDFPVFLGQKPPIRQPARSLQHCRSRLCGTRQGGPRGRLEPLAEVLLLNAPDDLHAEGVDERRPGGLLVNAPRQEVEDLVVLQVRHGAPVGALDIIRHDLEVGLDVHGGAGGEEEVARELAGVRLLRELVHADVAVEHPAPVRVRHDALVETLGLAPGVG